MIKEIQRGIVDHKIPLDQRKLLAFNTFMCLGIYPSHEVIMAKFNLTGYQVGLLIKKLRENNCKRNTQLTKVLYKHLQENT